MHHRPPLFALAAVVALGASPLVLSLLPGCGQYDAPPATAGTGGEATGTGGQAPAGTGGLAGGAAAGGGAGLPATGGASGSAGQAGTAGSASGAGGSSGAGSAGMPSTDGGKGGSGPTEASCDDVEACGGDLVGTWTVAGACLKISGELDLTGLGADCKSAPVTGTLAVTGTFTAKADGTYTDETNTTGEEQIELPPTCLTLSATTTTCAKIGRPLTSVGYMKATCVDNPATTGCSCTATVAQDGGLGLVLSSPPLSGTYTVAENVLSISDGLHETPYSYCVAGSSLTISPPSMSKTGTSTGTLLLQKQ